MPKKRKLTKQEQVELALRSQQLVHLIIQAECTVELHRGRKYIVVRSIHDYPAPGASNMIDMTDEIESFLWTGRPSASAIISQAIEQAAEEDKRL